MVPTWRRATWQILARFWLRSTRTLTNLRGSSLEGQGRMPSRIISERAFDFAVRIVRLCDRLWDADRAARKIADQLFDSGTSIGANVFESQGGQTKPDFLARLAISRKESWETIFWLRLAVATSIVTKEAVAWELDEAQQLRAMITAAIKTGQSSDGRGGGWRRLQ